jgi:hypothetical protein
MEGMFSCPVEDVLYMRFFKEGKVLRVARIDIYEGLCLALYPTKNKDTFSTEAFRYLDDESPRGKIERARVQDDIWIKLLDGVPKKEVVVDYNAALGDTYHFAKESFATFRITESEERIV